MSGNFLLIIPDGWIQLDWQYICNNIPCLDRISVENIINSNSVTMNMDEPLKAAGFVPQDKTVVAAKLIDDTYFIVQLG